LRLEWRRMNNLIFRNGSARYIFRSNPIFSDSELI